MQPRAAQLKGGWPGSQAGQVMSIWRTRHKSAEGRSKVLGNGSISGQQTARVSGLGEMT